MTYGLAAPRRYLAILAISFGGALVVIDGAIATVALPTISRDLHADPSSTVLVVTIYQLVLVMTLLPFSNLGERIGLRKLYQGGQTVFVAATILCFFARSLPFLLVVRGVQAIGAGASLSVSSALIRQIYSPKHLGRGLGFNVVILTVSAALAPVIGGFVLAFADWPWVFASAVPFALVSLAFGHSLPDPSPHDKPFDILGAVACAAMFGLVIAGLEACIHGDSPVVAVAIIAAGVVIGVIFVRRELHEPRPIMPVDLLRSPVVAFSIVGGLAATIAMQTLTLSLPFRLQHSDGFAPSEIGAMLVPMPLTLMVVAPLAGALSDRYPAGVLGTVGMTIAVAGLLLLADLPPEPHYFDVAWRMAVSGIGFGLFLSPNTRLVIGSAPPERTAAAGGLASTNRMVGQTLGATLVAALLAAGLGSSAMPPLISAGLALIAGACSLAKLRPILRKPPGGDVEPLLFPPPDFENQ